MVSSRQQHAEGRHTHNRGNEQNVLAPTRSPRRGDVVRACVRVSVRACVTFLK